LVLSTDYTDYTDGRSAVTGIGPAPALRAGGQIESRIKRGWSAYFSLDPAFDLADWRRAKPGVAGPIAIREICEIRG